MLELLRPFRNMGWFIFGVLLAAVPMFVFAETTPAIPSSTDSVHLWIYTSSPLNMAGTASSQEGACSVRPMGAGYTNGGVWSAGADFGCKAIHTATGTVSTGGTLSKASYCANVGTSSLSYGWITCTASPSCPSGQGWTLSGSICTRPDCIPPQTRDPSTGQCSVASCPVTNTEGYYSAPIASDLSGKFCTDGCNVSMAMSLGGNTPDPYQTMTTKWVWMSRSTDGTTCTSTTTPAPTTSTPPGTTPATNPPCPSGEGVATMGGKVICVPSTTPGATVPPIKSQSSSSTKFPDGSASTTTTTNTCTGDGACSSTSTTTVTASTAGGAGAAGTPGTTSQTQNKPPDPKSDFCAQNPSLQICKGGIAEEVTQKKILTEIESLTKPTFADDSALKTAGKYEPDQATKDANDKETQAATGGFDPIANNKTAMMQAMESGWFTPIPRSSCQPMGGQVGPYNWNFDLCPTAAKISEIGAYAMWFMLAWGTFLMVTGARREG